MSLFDKVDHSPTVLGWCVVALVALVFVSRFVETAIGRAEREP